MPKTGAQTRVQLADTGLNPTRTVAGAVGSSTGGQVITLELVFQGKAFRPEDVFDALEVKYGSGKVLSDRDQQSRGAYQFRIIP